MTKAAPAGATPETVGPFADKVLRYAPSAAFQSSWAVASAGFQSAGTSQDTCMPGITGQPVHTPCRQPIRVVSWKSATTVSPVRGLTTMVPVMANQWSVPLLSLCAAAW
ncbi:hypothetical protein ACFWD7_39740 [Streptomyces mirabilis]|uniref:hypothetical protein n=1 Tax=Streptomyces mirabilis TaxID=68239 RepID=UPI0036A4FC06